MKLSDVNLLDIGNGIDLAGAIYMGRGRAYLCWFPAIERTCDVESYLPVKADVETELHDLNMDLADWEKFLRQSDLQETEVHHKAADGTVTKAIMRKCQRMIDAGLQWQAFRRDCFACGWCFNDQVPLTIDHLIPWEIGGPTILENLLTSCRKCNKVRGNLELPEWFKDPYYQRVAGPAAQAQHLLLLKTVGGIQRVNNIRSR